MTPSYEKSAPPVRVAFVCLGNICRSPMAEAVARAMVDRAGLAGRVTVESFGTAGYHTGEPAHRQARAALARRGWPPDGHRARQITAGDLAALDLVLCADRSNLADVRRLAGPGADVTGIRLMRSFDPDVAGGVEGVEGSEGVGGPAAAEVPDPWGHPDGEFDRVLEMIERACRGLVDALASGAH